MKYLAKKSLLQAMIVCLLSIDIAAAEEEQQFISPQATFDTAKQSMVRGDYEMFCECFTEDGLSLMAGSLRMMTGMIEWAGKQENADGRSVKMAKGLGRINRRYVESQPAAKIQLDLNASSEEFMDGVRKMAEPKGRTDVVEALLDVDADIRRVSYKKWSALHFAADKGQFEAAQLLIDRGASLSAKTADGETPVDMNPNIAPSG